MPVGISVDVTLGGDYRRSLEILRKFSRRLRPAMRIGLRKLGETTSRELRYRYQRGHSTPLSWMTRRKRRIGKKPGKWPAVPSYPGTKPLYRSGALAKAVYHKRTGDLEHQTTIRRVFGPLSGGGRALSLGAIAAIQETGGPPVAVPVSFRMRNYLRVLAGMSRGGFGGRTPEGYTGKILYVRVPPRPLWGPYFEEITPRQAPKIMITGFIKGLGIPGLWS